MESSSHLWHYTSLENLEKILTDGFKLSTGDGERYDYLDKGDMSFMRVCFTNMGINDNDIHCGKYGQCFIGFTNDWVNRNQICPVIYCREQGRLTSILKEVMKQIDPITAQKLCQYCKQYSDYESENYNGPYQGDRWKLRRYDEHEWRYVPNGYSEEYLTFSALDVYAIYVTSKKEQRSLENKFPAYKGKVKVLKTKKNKMSNEEKWEAWKDEI